MGLIATYFYGLGNTAFQASSTKQYCILSASEKL